MNGDDSLMLAAIAADMGRDIPWEIDPWAHRDIALATLAVRREREAFGQPGPSAR